MALSKAPRSPGAADGVGAKSAAGAGAGGATGAIGGGGGAGTGGAGGANVVEPVGVADPGGGGVALAPPAALPGLAGMILPNNC